jgi:hypothetical protein
MYCVIRLARKKKRGQQKKRTLDVNSFLILFTISVPDLLDRNLFRTCYGKEVISFILYSKPSLIRLQLIWIEI